MSIVLPSAGVTMERARGGSRHSAGLRLLPQLVALTILVAFAPSFLTAQPTCLAYFPSAPVFVNCNFNTDGYPNSATAIGAVSNCVAEQDPCVYPYMQFPLVYDNGVAGLGQWEYETVSVASPCTGGGVGPYASNILPVTDSGVCDQYFTTATLPSLAEVKGKNNVGDPINPGMGNVTHQETDLKLYRPDSIEFTRFYNSNDSGGADGVPGWRYSYTRSVSTVYQTPQSHYLSVVNSNIYSTQTQACTSGFKDIQNSVPAWSGATVAYSGSVCSVSQGSVVVATLPILSPTLVTPPTTVVEYDVVRDDGQTLRYPVSNRVIRNPAGISLRLAVTGSGFTLTDDSDAVETYNSAGVLQSVTTRAGVTQTVSYSGGLLSGVTDSFGNLLSLMRNTNGTVASISLNGTPSVSYTYGGGNQPYGSVKQLLKVTNADGTVKTYQYNSSANPNVVTAIFDESQSSFPYIAWTYSGPNQASSSYLNASATTTAYATTLQYNPSGYPANSVLVTDALGAQRDFTFTRVGDINKVTSISGSQCPTCQDSATTTYDSYGWVLSRTDYNGNLTCYANDEVRGLELVRVEGFAPGSTCPASLSTYTPQSGTLQRKITTEWNSTWREPNTITEPKRTTSFSYDDYGNVLTKIITDTSVSPNVSRTWTYKYYNSGLYGQVQTATGPRTDITTDVTNYTYHDCTSGTDCGQIDTVTNALNQVTTFNTYNAYGQPLTITDPNGVVTTLTYDARERLTSREVGTEKTSYQYWPIGLVKLVTLPDASTVEFKYDAAHRLTTITDGAGNHIKYTLDALGNHTADNAYDPTGTLHRTHTRMFNTLSELHQDINAAGTPAVTTTYGYDGNGNQTSIDAPLGRKTVPAYDALNRLDQIMDPDKGITKIGYDANDNVASILDPRSLPTTYTHDGFNEVTKLVSPDTGTSSSAYDSAGNLKTTTDARGAVATYTYDALNRMTKVAYTDETISYRYDAGTDGKGHLTGASDANHSMSWTYNAQGRITGKGQTVAAVTKSVAYGYTNDDLTSIKTPSGQTVVYSYADHRITSIRINGSTLLSGVTYDPFGPATAWTWGNSSTVSRSYTEDGYPNLIVSAGVTNTYTMDDASRIREISDSGLASNTFSFGYDLLDRLTSATSSALNHGYTYDANGNRLTEKGTLAYSEKITPTNNRVASTSGGLVRTYKYDDAGDTTSYTGATFTFNDRGRMSSAVTSGGTTNYIYNALGQLIEKSGNGGITLLVYDEAGHLLGEYSSTGALIQETIWMGDLPVATLRPNGSAITIYYVHADHLGTPRKITNPSGNTVIWRWDPDTFGAAAPSVATISYNLRFPGQYYLPESGLYYNYFRDYDPQTGRYIESDPLGLGGSSWSPYTYANGNPVSNRDPLGLWSTAAHNLILENAFPSLTWGLQQAIENGSASVDAPWNQGASTAYQHAMTAPGQSPAAAQARMCAFVQQHLQAYQNLVGNADPTAQYTAYYALGQALHPIMDSTSPAHAGWQVWGNPWEPGWWGEWDTHGDNSGSIEDVAHLTPALLADTLNRINQAMSGSGMCGCEK